jgi:hypothetical protein
MKARPKFMYIGKPIMSCPETGKKSLEPIPAIRIASGIAYGRPAVIVPKLNLYDPIFVWHFRLRMVDGCDVPKGKELVVQEWSSIIDSATQPSSSLSFQ